MELKQEVINEVLQAYKHLIQQRNKMVKKLRKGKGKPNDLANAAITYHIKVMELKPRLEKLIKTPV